MSRFNATLFPALSWAGNFPPCLHKRQIPRPNTVMSTEELLTYMPTTNILGKYANFFYFFIFTEPHERMIPDAGVGEELFFPGGPDEPRNQALIRFRFDLLAFAARFDPTSVRASQWPLNVET